MCGVILTGFPHLTTGSFESSLASDKVLVHFLNDFLSLPSFPDSVVYNQRSGLFEVVSGAAGVVSSRIRSALLHSRSLLLTSNPTVPSTTPKVDNQYIVQCLDREEGIQWIKRERLPFFFDSDCYHEYRLAKFLLQWDPNLYLHRGKSTSDRDTRSATQLRPSQFDQITQQTETNSVLEEDLRESSGQMFDSLEQQLQYLAAKVVKEVLKDVENLMDEQSWTNTSGDETNCPGADKSSEGSVCRRSADKHRERLWGEKEKVEDGKRGSEGEEQSEWDWKNREEASRGTHQEKVLDNCSRGVCCQVSRPGLDDFREFLRGKQGEKVIKLWMDIERLKATRQEERKKRYLALMRIWYLMSSSPTCLNAELLSRLGLTTSPCWTEEKLQSVQSYLTDSLLHYWAPRFLTSQRVRESLTDPPPLVLHTGSCHMSHPSTPSCHGSSAPPLLPPDTCRTQSSRTVHTQLQFIGGEDLLRRREKMLQALCAESRSGFYFTHFCEQSGNQLWVNAVYCWTDLQHYHKLFYPDGRDPYRVQREAQLLHFTYISCSARSSISVDEEIRGEVYDQLMSASEEMFDRVEKHVLRILLEPWTLLVNKDKLSFQQVCVQEEVRHIHSQEFRELQSLYEESELQMKQLEQLSSSSITPPTSSSKSPILSESWSRVAPEYQGYRLGSLLRHRHEIDHFMTFLKNQEASIHLRCWLDLERYRRTSQRDKEIRQRRSRHIVTKYLNTKYFFSLDSPATAEQQGNILQMTSGLECLEYDCLSNKVVVEVRDIIRTYIERTWLPLFLSTAEFTERQKRKAEAEGLWMSSSKEITQFRRVLLNPVTCQLFQLFVSMKGDFLENDVHFWLEAQKYKDICDSHSDEPTIQKKISTIISCFINSSVPPALQIDIPPEQAQNILDNSAKLDPYIFREAQMSVFNELLKYWPEFEEFINNMEEEQLLPLLQEKQEKYRARVRRQRIKEEEEEDAKRRVRDKLVSQDSSLGEEEEADFVLQDGGNERKQSRKMNRLSWLFSKYMAGLKKEEVMLRKQSQSFSETGTAWRSRMIMIPNPANVVITAETAWTTATAAGPAPPQRAKKPPQNAPPPPARGVRRAKASCVRKVEGGGTKIKTQEDVDTQLLKLLHAPLRAHKNK